MVPLWKNHTQNSHVSLPLGVTTLPKVFGNTAPRGLWGLQKTKARTFSPLPVGAQNRSLNCVY
jgi:hypothetical protein